MVNHNTSPPSQTHPPWLSIVNDRITNKQTISWWRYEVETLSALQSPCERNPSKDSRHKGPVIHNIDVFFGAGLVSLVYKHSSCMWFVCSYVYPQQTDNSTKLLATQKPSRLLGMVLTSKSSLQCIENEAMKSTVSLNSGNGLMLTMGCCSVDF